MKTHILLIDDDQDELEIFMRALKQMPDVEFKCTYANCPEQAMEMLNYLLPDYIFLDYRMPRMDGIECLSAIKKQQRLNNCRIFFWSTDISSDIQQKAMNLGATACIKKTSSVARLSSIIRAMLKPATLPVTPETTSYRTFARKEHHMM